MKCPVHILHQNHDFTVADLISLLIIFNWLKDGLCYVPCMLNWIEIVNIIKCMGKFHSQWLYLISGFSPISGVSCYISNIFPLSERHRLFWKLKKNITVLWFKTYFRCASNVSMWWERFGEIYVKQASYKFNIKQVNVNIM
jgi:hypothetical protein